MTNYREILRLRHEGFSERSIARSCNCSRTTVSNVLKKARETGITWLTAKSETDGSLQEKLFKKDMHSPRRMPDFTYIHKELLKSGVTKKLLWIEYVEETNNLGEVPLMYSQFCSLIQADEQKRRATMHLSHRPGEQIEVDWAGDPMYFTDKVTGSKVKAFIFIGVLSYSQYIFAEAFTDEKQRSWLQAHIDMYRYFGGVTKILIPDNCLTAVTHSRDSWFTPKLNESYHSLAEHYGTAIIPARVRHPKDKPSAESSVRQVCTRIVAVLRNRQFFSLAELNEAIKEKLAEYNHTPFQKKAGSRYQLFHEEELPLLLPLPANAFEIAVWKTAIVQYNYHVQVEGMFYSVPYEHIRHQTDVRITDATIEIYYNKVRIASHRKLYGKKGQYSTVKEHMPEKHQHYLEWDARRFRNWAENIGPATRQAVNSILTYHQIEQQGYRTCLAILKLAEKISPEVLEYACSEVIRISPVPSYKAIKDFVTRKIRQDKEMHRPTGITRGAAYFGRKK